MMKRTIFITMLLLVSIAAPAKEESIEQLKARADAAEAAKKPALYAELAHRQLEQADSLYNTDPEGARKLAEQSIASAIAAGTFSVQTGKDLKKTEIRLRKLEDRMHDMQRSWAFEDRQPLKDGAERVDAARSKLLDRMFKK